MNIDIDKITSIPDVRIGGGLSSGSTEDIILKIKDKEIKVTKKQIDAYNDIVNPDTPFGKKILKFFAGTSEAGRWGKVVKDFALLITPFGSTINNATDMVTEIIKEKVMPEEEKKAVGRSKTVVVFGLLFVVGLLQILGVDIGLELSPDAQWVTTGAGIVGIALRLITGKPVNLKKLL